MLGSVPYGWVRMYSTWYTDCLRITGEGSAGFGLGSGLEMERLLRIWMNGGLYAEEGKVLRLSD
jgi:hypothetical protein